MHYSLAADVRASAEEVWPLLVDVERWPTMTASMREVRRVDTGPLRVGSEVFVIQPKLPPMRWRVVEFDPGRSFTWVAKAGGVTTTAGHIVEPRGDGSKVTLTLEHRGFFAGAINAMLGRLAQK